MSGPIVPRFMFYSHDGFGLGHFHRNLVLSRALLELHPTASVLLVCGTEGLDSFSLPKGVDVLRLPGLRKLGNGRYEGRRLALQPDEMVNLRAALLASTVEHFRPHVLLVDKHPVGVYDELLPALRQLRRDGGRAALGLRDVLDDPDDTANEWRLERLGPRVSEFHDMVLIYGSKAVLDPLTPGLLPPDMDDRVTFCGYVVGQAVRGAPPVDLPNGEPKPLVVASVGGGEDGLPVLHAFIDASRGAPWQGVLVGGPQMESARWAQIEARATASGVLAYRSVHQMQRWFPHVSALVCMGGYNTLLEAVTSGTPTVCIPRTRPRREQLIRARAFAAKGLVQVIEPEILTGRRLALAIRKALRTPRPMLIQRAADTLDLDGSRRAADLLLQLAGGSRSPAARVGPVHAAIAAP
jgi:predicted glycosyltransferase